MTEQEQEQDAFIKQALINARYKDPEKTRGAVLEVIKHYGGLEPVADTFVFNNGSQKLLLSLKGTIPIIYKGWRYNIPIIIWLLDTHPFNAPMVYVNPTPDMRLKSSRHVDSNGKVSLPYLHDWKHSTSELMCLIQVLIVTFQEQPPVYSVAVAAPAPAPGPGRGPAQPQFSFTPAYPYPPYAYGTPYPSFSVDMNAMPYQYMPPGRHAIAMSAYPQPALIQNQNYQNIAGTSTPTPIPAFDFRTSLLSAAGEKLRRRLEDAYLSTEVAKKSGDRLKEGRSKLETMLKRQSDDKSLLEQNIQTYEKECAELDGKIRALTCEENDSNLDDAIQAPAPLYKQMVDAAAAEAALEDTIYYLGKGLNEKMDLHQYVRTVRELSRKQFMERALLNECRKKAGLTG